MNRSGLTIIEALISIVILAIVLAGGMGFYFYLDELTVSASHRRMAIQLANSRMEQEKSTNFGSLSNFGPNNILIGSFQGQIQGTVTGIDDPAGGTPVDYKKVEIQVTWNEVKHSTPEEIALTTYIAP